MGQEHAEPRRRSPTIPPSATSRSRTSFPNIRNDSWYQAALTIQGKIGNLDLTYAGAYMDRADHSRSSTTPTIRSSTMRTYGSLRLTNDAGKLIDPSQAIWGRDHFTKIATKSASPRRRRSPAFRRRPVLRAQTHYIQQRYVIKDLETAFRSPAGPTRSG